MDTIKVLDHGYVTLVEGWGSDERIVEAARMSTGKGFKGWGPLEERCTACGGFGCQAVAGTDGNLGPCTACDGKGFRQVPGDERLLAYLWNNKHSTPFEMAGVTIEVKAPIFVFRQWHRHRTQSYNEMSARYTPLFDECFMPSAERCVNPATRDGAHPQNRQAAGVSTHVAAHEEILAWLESLQASYDMARRVYEEGLRIGVPKEIARLPVSVANYSVMRASANLRNWLAFETLRLDKHAQEEIRVYAEAVGTFLSQLFPRTWDLFMGKH